MKIDEVTSRNKIVRLRNDPKLGDYSNEVVELRPGDGQFTSPRGKGPTLQYFVCWGPGSYERDWIDADLLDGAVEVYENK